MKYFRTKKVKKLLVIVASLTLVFPFFTSNVLAEEGNIVPDEVLRRILNDALFYKKDSLDPITISQINSGKVINPEYIKKVGYIENGLLINGAGIKDFTGLEHLGPNYRDSAGSVAIDFPVNEPYPTDVSLYDNVWKSTYALNGYGMFVFASEETEKTIYEGDNTETYSIHVPQLIHIFKDNYTKMIPTADVLIDLTAAGLDIKNTSPGDLLGDQVVLDRIVELMASPEQYPDIISDGSASELVNNISEEEPHYYFRYVGADRIGGVVTVQKVNLKVIPEIDLPETTEEEASSSEETSSTDTKGVETTEEEASSSEETSSTDTKGVETTEEEASSSEETASTDTKGVETTEEEASSSEETSSTDTKGVETTDSNSKESKTPFLPMHDSSSGGGNANEVGDNTNNKSQTLPHTGDGSFSDWLFLLGLVSLVSGSVFIKQKISKN
ncbi:LPXTG cell wall anchor domain-containing protein [Brochothrix thermosphacta]|uniref:LPXTG cell wall anchor domain-containing protein n=1 Tax=Brochothrix thermosphacta TaxID=2756 RepID=UPI001C4E907D|nr:LPXTG cell wall anchor domain-containing protein [Brochothrix thermosphacta]